MTYAYRTEPQIDRDGKKSLIVYRRKILSRRKGEYELGAVSRAVVTPGTEPDWKEVGGLLGRSCWLSDDRFRSCGYSTKPPREVQQ
jgi:hypothetical protein